MISRFVANSEKCRKYTFLGGSAQIITILHRGGYQNLLQYYMGGGSSRFITILQGGGGGSLGTPNLYYVIYGRPLMNKIPSKLEVAPHALKMSDWMEWMDGVGDTP